MSEYELPLVFFTVLCQWAVGSIIAITALMTVQPVWLNEETRFNRLRYMALVILAINIVGSFLSLLHLGSPLGAYRAILGLGHSWLSREVVAFFLLNGVVFIWAVVMFRFNRSRALVKSASFVASLAGIAAILVSAQVYYQMASHPMWHSLVTHLSFIATALLLGFVTISLMVAVYHYRQQAQQSKIPGLMLTGILLGVLLMLCVVLWYSHGLNGQGQMVGSAIAVLGSGLMGWLIFGGLITGTGVATYLYKQSSVSMAKATLLMLVVLSAAVCGRMLFYSGVMSQSPWF
ncbi:dimethyl sulfoxide reductase anchor subunit [Budviciaceae bacterium CWB-B4]|uniref:Dimethyl sulfoxide reductase anchor subunit n=1 Tax=Limnobaculum xujianqingii TaxID=2738837 RepID=A0A9D7FRR5_9GAMM|nr:DmsC/YnfH family molybdoenzyme membrane anchor subunit [Limnobaculum xujianqingii]MBK5072359.1 dimethyl sulfoxide reductase anchor subunit [Limnobaculum xujianqingii]MBK5175668.1 dimethyl sulfoxide reductase anchor subunit [Limnobaculum xujianqingii]